MELLLKAAGFAVVGAVLVMFLKKNTKDSGIALSILCCCGIGVAAVSMVGPILSFAEQLRQMSGIDEEMASILLKTAAVALITQLASSICSDAGEQSIAKMTELCGTIAAVYLALPLLRSVLKLLEKILGG